MMAARFPVRLDEKQLNTNTKGPALSGVTSRLVHRRGAQKQFSDPVEATSQRAPGRRYRVELITAESEASLFVRHRRLIRFPQLTMPLLAAWTPDHWEVSHTDEIVQPVDFNHTAAPRA